MQEGLGQLVPPIGCVTELDNKTLLFVVSDDSAWEAGRKECWRPFG